jgi:hypothetical protein
MCVSSRDPKALLLLLTALLLLLLLLTTFWSAWRSQTPL